VFWAKIALFLHQEKKHLKLMLSVFCFTEDLSRAIYKTGDNTGIAPLETA
jgi:hypothetical protein